MSIQFEGLSPEWWQLVLVYLAVVVPLVAFIRPARKEFVRMSRWARARLFTWRPWRFEIDVDAITNWGRETHDPVTYHQVPFRLVNRGPNDAAAVRYTVFFHEPPFWTSASGYIDANVGIISAGGRSAHGLIGPHLPGKKFRARVTWVQKNGERSVRVPFPVWLGDAPVTKQFDRINRENRRRAAREEKLARRAPVQQQFGAED